MPTAPTAVDIRMYNVGFGDCFLLTFSYPKGAKHVLLDFGSTSAPKRGGTGDYMNRVAVDIKRVSGGKLEGIIATHRHRDHISGFALSAKSGKTIAELNPNFVIQPWTEDPRAKPSALTANSSVYTNGKPSARKMTAHFLGSLEDMHKVATSIEERANAGQGRGSQARKQSAFLGNDNIKNLSAVNNLMAMGKRGKAYYVNAGMKLNILPGVNCTVLGPPTLKQSNSIRKERARDPSEFWQFRSFWASQHFAAASVPRVAARSATTRNLPIEARWFVKQAQQIQADQMLSIVRDLDSVMNNTSVILLLEVGRKSILLPGDAQIENWSYALSKSEWVRRLRAVNLYKVGHHGSLNATPRSLWALFKNKGDPSKPNRLNALCSTKGGKHGSLGSGTEVPRKLLEEKMAKESTFKTSEDPKESFCQAVRLTL
jgi:hypothetical protein